MRFFNRKHTGRIPGYMRLKRMAIIGVGSYGMKKVTVKSETKEKKPPVMEINLIPLLTHLLKKLWIILLVSVIAGGLGYAAAKMFIQPTYKCSFTAYVNNKKAATTTDYLNSSDVSAAKQLVLTYSQIINSNKIMASADEAMKASYDIKKLKRMVGTEIQDETEIIRVYAIANSPEEAYEIASAIAKVSPKIMADIVEGSSMKIVENPQLPDSIYKPNYRNYIILGCVFGALLTIAVLIIMYLRNDTVNDEEELEGRFSVPVLGVIPDVNQRTSDKYGYYKNYYAKRDEGEEN